jgi:hypothetical protein
MYVIPPTCPKCTARSTVVAQKPFCDHCGWNLANAREALKYERMAVWTCIAVSVLVGLWLLFGYSGGWSAVVAAGGMASIVLGYYFLSIVPAQQTLNAAEDRLGLTTEQSEEHGDLTNKQDTPRPTQPDWSFRTSRPRAVQVDWRKAAKRFGSRALLVGAFSLIFAADFLTMNHNDSRGLFTVLLAIAAAVLMFGGIQMRVGLRKYRLIQSGEVAIGRVLSQTLSGEWKQSSTIAYEFEDRMGSLVSGKAKDIGGSLFEGMSVPVFYSSENSDEHVALCETIFSVAVEAGA